MKKRELIEKLKDFNDDDEIYIFDDGLFQSKITVEESFVESIKEIVYFIYSKKEIGSDLEKYTRVCILS